MVTVVSESEVRDALVLDEVLDTVAEALSAQAAGRVERPDRPHFPVGTGLDGEHGSDGDGPPGTGLVMPAYIHGEPYYATKLVGVYEGNKRRGMPTINAQIVLTDAATGQPVAFMGGTTITNARTGCVGGCSVRAFAPAAATVGVLGAGAQARWQSRAIDAVADLDALRVYSPSDSRNACATELSEEGIPAKAVESPGAAVRDTDVVVTATTSRDPVFPADALSEDALVIAVGAYTEAMQELPAGVVEGAARVYADVPEEAIETGDFCGTDVGVEDVVALGTVFGSGRPTVDAPAGVTVVKSVGSAVLDVATAQTVFETADGVAVTLG